ncbi:MAG: hypothetical protein IKS79_06985 [Bacteroidales bacterium]|nr:hypothetical protein [Bacteroidales bacterium]
MKKAELEAILKDLKELQRQLIFARMTKDRRSREKNISEARLSISNYACRLPDEVKCVLEDKVDVNAMSYQYAEGDIGRCIPEIEGWIKAFLNDSLECFYIGKDDLFRCNTRVNERINGEIKV